MSRPVFMLLTLLPQLVLAQVEVRELATRPDVTLRFIHGKAANAVASAVLFQGGGGNVGIFPNGTVRNENFLSGGARRFMDNGISVAIVDVPSDRRSLDGFRHTPEHARDAAAVIAFLRQQAGFRSGPSAPATVRFRPPRLPRCSRRAGPTASSSPHRPRANRPPPFTR